MKLYIPSVGDQIRLVADWEPTIHDESRNSSIFEFFQIPGYDPDRWNNNMPPTKVLIPAGEILKIDRIYIRKGKDDFDSVTFLWKGKSTNPRMGRYFNEQEYKIPRVPVRFWAKLGDVNQIEFEQV